MAAAFVVTIVGTGLLSERAATRLSAVPSVSYRVGANTPRSERCPHARLAVVGRRNATWRWQDTLELVRTRTVYRERATKACPYLGWLKALWAGRADRHWNLYASLRDAETAIRFVFGRYADEALAVAECESGLSRRAHNGQYLGLFQMGSYARGRYGHGESALEQARAAYRYFVESGRDWSPWSCGWAA